MNDFELFCKKLKELFGDPNERATAERNLYALKQKGSATSYLADFQRYSVLVEWNDQAKMAQFYRGLKEMVKDELAKQDDSQSLTELMERAVNIDTRLYERNLEKCSDTKLQEGRETSASPRLRSRSAMGARSHGDSNDDSNLEGGPSRSGRSSNVEGGPSRSGRSSLRSSGPSVYPAPPRSAPKLPPLAEMLPMPMRLAPRQTFVKSVGQKTVVDSPLLTALSLDLATYGHRGRSGDWSRDDVQTPVETISSMSSRQVPHSASLSPRLQYLRSTTQPSLSYHSCRPPSRSRHSEDEGMSPNARTSRHPRRDSLAAQFGSQPQNSTSRTAITASSHFSPPTTYLNLPQPTLAPVTYRPGPSRSSRPSTAELQRSL
jgi:hypothetical protein